MNNVDPALAQERSKPAHLFRHVPVIKTVERELRDLLVNQLFCFGKQWPRAAQTRKVHVITSALDQQTREQHQLSFCAAGLKAVEQQQDIGF